MPILKINGSCFLNSLSMLSIECKRMFPASPVTPFGKSNAMHPVASALLRMFWRLDVKEGLERLSETWDGSVHFLAITGSQG